MGNVDGSCSGGGETTCFAFPEAFVKGQANSRVQPHPDVRKDLWQSGRRIPRRGWWGDDELPISSAASLVGLHALTIHAESS